MNATLTGTVTLTFIRGGISAKNGKPYLSVSNGRKEFFVNIPKDSNLVDENTFSEFKENDPIELVVAQIAGNDSVELIEVV